MSLAPEDLRPQIVARWRRYLKQRVKADDPVFGPWHDLMAAPEADLAAKGSASLLSVGAPAAGHASRPVESAVAERLARPLYVRRKMSLEPTAN